MGIFFLLVYSCVSFFTPERFNSPDEAANFYWSERVAFGNRLASLVLENRETGNAVHLRSDNVNNTGEVVPGGFLGLPLVYGFLGKVFTPTAIKFFTSIFAVAAVWCFYGLVKKIFSSSRVAIISSILLFVNPVWWYYASRGLLPNVLFVSLLLISAWLVFCCSKNIYWRYVLGGLFFGLALAARTAEIFWLATIILALAVVYRKQINGLAMILFLVFTAAPLLVVLFINKDIYGGYFVTGYSSLAAPVDTTAFITGNSISVLPFGFHPRTALINWWNYQVQMLWWYFIPMIVGLVFSVRDLVRQYDVKKWFYLIIFVVLSDWLTVYYGSWAIKDNISGHYTIGTSYLRYWLPIVVFAVPFVAYAINYLLDWLKQKWSKILVGILFFGIIVSLSAQLVLTSEEGLISVVQNINQYQKTNLAAQQQFSSRDKVLIVSDRSDKVFWPEFKVVKFMGDFGVFERLSSVVSSNDVYYYSHNNLTAENLQYLNDNIKQLGLVLERQGTLNGGDELYKLKVSAQGGSLPTGQAGASGGIKL